MDFLFDEGLENGKKLILLHGTGGDEHSLVDAVRFLDENCTILSFRGRIKEDGMNRFFRRNGLNQFDSASLEKETDHLLAEIKDFSQKKGIPMKDWIFFGFSNGANIAAHLLLERETEIRTAILLHPMSVIESAGTFSLADKKIWLSFGIGDPIVSEKNIEKLAGCFEKRNADITVALFDQGHQVTMDELEEAKRWLDGPEDF